MAEAPKTHEAFDAMVARARAEFERLAITQMAAMTLRRGEFLEEVLFKTFMTGWLLGKGIPPAELGRELMVEAPRN